MVFIAAHHPFRSAAMRNPRNRRMDHDQILSTDHSPRQRLHVRPIGQMVAYGETGLHARYADILGPLIHAETVVIETGAPASVGAAAAAASARGRARVANEMEPSARRWPLAGGGRG